MKENKKKIRLSSVLLTLLCILLCVVIAAPLLWIILNSFKTNPELFMDSLALPKQWMFGNYVKAWTIGLYRYFGNSILVSADLSCGDFGAGFFSGLWSDPV